MSGEDEYEQRFAGKRFDCGSKLGDLQATGEYALVHPGLSRSFRSYLLRLTEDLARSAPAVRKATAKSKAKGSKKRRNSAARRRQN